MIRLHLLNPDGLSVAQEAVTRWHYLHQPVDRRCMPEAYAVKLAKVTGFFGFLIVGRPQATKVKRWYGSVEDVARGRAEVTRWQVLNLARVWLDRSVQPGGELHSPHWLPGFTDRKGAFRSTLASDAIRELARVVVRDYLVRRPPCFLEEPYELRWLLSYCNTHLHRGTIYRAAGFELFRTNKEGMQTWRLPVRSLGAAEDAEVREAAGTHPRSRLIRGRRAQGSLALREEVAA